MNKLQTINENTPKSNTKKRDLSSPTDCNDIKRNKPHTMADAMDSHTQIELSEDNMKYIATCLSDQFSKSGPVMNDDQFEKLSTKVVESVMIKFDDKIKSLQEENSVLRGRIFTLEHQMDAANQYSRRNSLRISRVDEFVGTPLPLTSEGTATSAGVVSKPKKTPLMSREDTDAYVLKCVTIWEYICQSMILIVRTDLEKLGPPNRGIYLLSSQRIEREIGYIRLVLVPKTRATLTYMLTRTLLASGLAYSTWLDNL